MRTMFSAGWGRSRAFVELALLREDGRPNIANLPLYYRPATRELGADIHQFGLLANLLVRAEDARVLARGRLEGGAVCFLRGHLARAAASCVIGEAEALELTTRSFAPTQ